MDNVRHALKKKYDDLLLKYGFEQPLNGKVINGIIKQSLQDFLKNTKKPAIYCKGGHTQVLMADFMYELKNVRYIIDNFATQEDNSGFRVIRDKDIEKEEIDAIILSTYKFRDILKQQIEKEHANIPVLDIYDEFEKNGIELHADYYYSNHPYHHYHTINLLQRKIKEVASTDKKRKLYEELIVKYIHIKDFRIALLKAQELNKIYPNKWLKTLCEDLEELYHLEQKAACAVSSHNVLMFCMDGLRYQDLSEKDMPKVRKVLDETFYNFEKAYSFSTSTFESLIPVYSENGNLQTRYYEKNIVDAEECRFIELARQQGRNIYIYGDMNRYIKGTGIQHSDQFQTVTEKIWDFILDASEEENGLFYIHELYESHFTFSNPYTETSLKSEGTAMLFDFLPAKGGRLRTDYKVQHQDAIRYLDDVLEPFLSKLSCRMVLYADHGNLILDKDTKLEDVKDMEYTCSEGWTRIPIAIRSPEEGVGKNTELISLMELSSMIVSLLMEKSYMKTAFRKSDHIKLARSELYNPDFRYLYRTIGKEPYLQAFECFVFESGYKLVVFEDGYTELRSVKEDSLINDEEKKKQLLESVKFEITVCHAMIDKSE